MKKRKKTLIILIVLLVVAVAAYLAITLIGGGNNEEVEEEKEIYTIKKIDRLEVESITYTFQGETLTLEQVADEQWVLLEDETFPVYDYRVTLMSGCMANIVSEDKLDDSAEYKLDDPVIVVNAVYSDGTELAMAIGEYSSYEDRYYARFSNMEGVYLIETKFYRYFAFTLNQLATPEDMPSIRSSGIQSVDIIGAEDGDFSMRLAQEGELYNDDYAFVTQTADGQIVGVDQDMSKQMINEIGDMETYACHDYDATEEEKKAVGIDGSHVITVNYVSEGVDETMVLDVGDKDEEGYRYCVINDSRMIVLISGVTLDWMIETSNESARTNEVCNIAQKYITALDVDYNGKTYNFTIDWKGASTAEYFLAGEQLGTNKFRSFFNPLNELEADDFESVAVTGEPVMSVVMYCDIEGYEQMQLDIYKNGDSYIASFNGISDFVISQKDYDEIVEALEEI